MPNIVVATFTHFCDVIYVNLSKHQFHHVQHEDK